MIGRIILARAVQDPRLSDEILTSFRQNSADRVGTPDSATVQIRQGSDRTSNPGRQDSTSNPEHMKFALRGCLAASLCYVIL